MEFLLYLYPNNSQIYNLVSTKVNIVENANICNTQNIFGYYSSFKKQITICTETIKKYNNPSYYINEVFLHESVHLAQSCKGNMQYLEPLGIDWAKMKLDSRREHDYSKSIQNSLATKIVDREAFWLEDKPNQVKYFVQKYCF